MDRVSRRTVLQQANATAAGAIALRWGAASLVADFLEAIRSNKRPCADIEIGHRSATLAHLANILAKAGRQRLVFDPQTERVGGDPEADVLTGRTYREGHWAALKTA